MANNGWETVSRKSLLIKEKPEKNPPKVFAAWQGSGGYYGEIVISKIDKGYLVLLNDEDERRYKFKTKSEATRKAMKIFKPILKQFKKQAKDEEKYGLNDYDVWLGKRKIMEHKSRW